MSPHPSIPAPIPFDNSFARLPGQFYTSQNPDPVSAPTLLLANLALAEDLGIDPAWIKSPDGVATFSGNHIPNGAEPLSQVYAGHQFGGWNPQLGDGRAVLLGEVIDRGGQRRDLQLKGSGRTPYSRGGDGRAWIGPVLREFVVSEAMYALGIPTTRALTAVATGDLVHRDSSLPGAVLCRVASSHIRIGTFQYFAARRDQAAVRALLDYAIERHYPEVETALDFLKAVVARQAQLIAQWMSVGFIHGVMNTDNMTISGETIDYGPCAFMDQYHPETLFSSIDRTGRYAYLNQPRVAPWNLAQLATSLLPLIGETDQALQAASDVVNGFTSLYEAHWLRLFGRKIGLADARPEDRPMIEAFLSGLQTSQTDFTNGFRGLLNRTVPNALSDWKADWLARLDQDSGDIQAVMRTANPAYIPRNHRIEDMIEAALNGDLGPTTTLSAVLSKPFDDQPEHARYQAPPKPDEVVQQTFCGT